VRYGGILSNRISSARNSIIDPAADALGKEAMDEDPATVRVTDADKEAGSLSSSYTCQVRIIVKIEQ
jgi:hypothetical protein